MSIDPLGWTHTPGMDSAIAWGGSSGIGKAGYHKIAIWLRSKRLLFERQELARKLLSQGLNVVIVARPASQMLPVVIAVSPVNFSPGDEPVFIETLKELKAQFPKQEIRSVKAHSDLMSQELAAYGVYFIVHCIVYVCDLCCVHHFPVYFLYLLCCF